MGGVVVIGGTVAKIVDYFAGFSFVPRDLERKRGEVKPVNSRPVVPSCSKEEGRT